MKIAPVLILIVGLAGVAGKSQSVTTGTARSSGACSVAHSGNSDTIIIKNCGIGAEQGQKIVSLLKEVLAGQNLDAINAKLEYLAKIVTQPTEFIVSQQSSGPNSPNISGNGNQITYTNSAQLPVLDASQIKSITDSLGLAKGNVVITANQSDQEATIMAQDLTKALKDAGWEANYLLNLGGGVQISVPALIVTKSVQAPGAGLLQHVLKTSLGIDVPGVLDSSVPEGTIKLFLNSHPVKRPQ